MNIHQKSWDYLLSCYLDNELGLEDRLLIELELNTNSQLRKHFDRIKHSTEYLERVLNKYQIENTSLRNPHFTIRNGRASIMTPVDISNKQHEMQEERSKNYQPYPEQSIQENFEIIEKIGSGGMSRVYMVKQKSMNRIIALKVCKSALQSGDKISQGFLREVKLISAVTHENIGYALMAAHDKKIDRMYYAMEYIDGPSLERLIVTDGKIKERAALELVISLAMALECLHSSKIVHLDIKPGNLILNSTGVLKLVDFGVARRIEDKVCTVKQSNVEGTPLYMAPEQSGLIPDSIDARTDLYAVGCTLFHMLTGHPPFLGNS
jgi:serine/threonine protein kinase